MFFWGRLLFFPGSNGEENGKDPKGEGIKSGTPAVDQENGQVPAKQSDEVEETYAELRKWADTGSPKYLMLSVRREKRAGYLGKALKVSPESVISKRAFQPESCNLIIWL
jgi:hypothetical protein